MTALEQMGKNAKVAARKLGTLQEKKDAALTAIAAALREKTPEILAANAIDLQSGGHDFGADGQTAPDPRAH